MYSTFLVSLLVLKETSASNGCCTANVAMSDAFENCRQTNEQSCVEEQSNCQWIKCSKVGYCADSTIENVGSKKANKKNRGCAQFIEEGLCNMFGAGCVWKEGKAPKEYTVKGGYYFDENGFVILGEHNNVETKTLFAADKYTSLIMNTPWGFISFVSFIFTFSIICMVATLICGCKRIKRYTEERMDSAPECDEVLPEQTTLLNTAHHGSVDTVEGLAFCE